MKTRFSPSSQGVLVGILLVWASLVQGVAQPGSGAPPVPVEKVVLPEGFEIGLYASGVKNARSMALSPSGVLFVGTRQEGKVYAVTDGDQDLRGDRVYVLDEELNMPNGVAFRDGSLYVAEVNRILRYENIEARLQDPPDPVVVLDTLPTDRHHGWKYIAFGPDGLLYVPVGAPCNICERLDDPRYASILRMKSSGEQLEIFASGVRNSVGFDWHPETGALWFTDNGRDMLGDNVPPDELNVAGKPGLHFGYPYCHGGFLSDPEFGDKKSCRELEPPVINLGPHVAALGAEFYSGEMFPPEYRNQLFIAEHGSWNRSIPLGYRITLARIVENERAVYYQVFAEGWLEGEDPWGRPVDLEQLPDGSILVSDDLAGVIYRITYSQAGDN